MAGMFRRFLKRLLSPFLVVLAALFLFVEEWLWVHLQTAMAWVGRLPGIRGMEKRIAGLPPYPAMVLFLVPGLLLLPVKIGALFLIGRGFAVTGITTIVAAKVAGTAIVARLFALCRQSLLTIGWFAKLYCWIVRVKTTLYARIKAMAFWQAAVRIKLRVARMFRHFRGGALRRRWAAVRRLAKRRRRRRNPAPSASEPPVRKAAEPGCE